MSLETTTTSTLTDLVNSLKKAEDNKEEYLRLIRIIRAQVYRYETTVIKRAKKFNPKN